MIIVHLLAFVYVICIIMYTIYREGYCADFLPRPKKFLASIETPSLIVRFDTGIIVYGLIANALHFGLLSYIGAEFALHLTFDLCYKYPVFNGQHLYLPN